jgi:hypothetical protein
MLYVAERYLMFSFVRRVINPFIIYRFSPIYYSPFTIYYSAVLVTDWLTPRADNHHASSELARKHGCPVQGTVDTRRSSGDDSPVARLLDFQTHNLKLRNAAQEIYHEKINFHWIAFVFRCLTRNASLNKCSTRTWPSHDLYVRG